jgi:shikimate kinase
MSEGCIILIGMPGAGKSTVGPLLAQKKGLIFKDTDAIVKQMDGRDLKTIVAEDGFEAFLDIQQKVILSQELKNCVVATGGSVIKSDTLMQFLKRFGTIIYLKVDFKVLEQRLAPERKLARAGGQSFRQVFEEREPLYIKYADSIIDCTGKIPDEIVIEITGKRCR